MTKKPSKDIKLTEGVFRYHWFFLQCIISGVSFINPWLALALSFAMWVYWLVFA